MISKSNKNWQTSNKNYGSHYNNNNTNKILESTLQNLKKNDRNNFIHEQQNIAQKQRVGLFTQPMGLSPGDQYKDPQIYRPQKNISINQKMQQKVGPELFSKMSCNNIGDLYKDKFRSGQLYAKQKNDLSIHPHTFMAGGKQKLIKNSQYQHQKQYNDKIYQTRDQQGKVKLKNKNMYTNAMKKGYGNTTVGHLFTSYPYQGDAYDNAKDQQRNERIKHKAHIPQPFIGGTAVSNTFQPDHNAFNKATEPYNPQKDDEQYRGKSVGGNWKYNNPNKKGYNGTFTKFPQYIEQGEIPHKLHEQQKIWKPNFNGTSKGYGQTLAKPSVAPSQLVLNDIRRQK